MGNHESELISDSPSGNRKSWVTAKEVAGLVGMPTTDRRTRDILDEWADHRDGVKRKRSGTKAFEYHISILPKYVLDALTTGGFFLEDPDTGNPEQNEYPIVTSIMTPPLKEPALIYGSFLDEFALIPGYRVQVSAGHGTLTQGEMEPCRHLAFRRKWLQWRGFAEKELAIVWAKGDSMEPTIANNDTLVVHLGRTHPVDGHIYVVRNDDQLWVKRLQVLPSAWLLLSDNKHYEPIKVPKDEQHNFDVIGQVVHIAHDVGE